MGNLRAVEMADAVSAGQLSLEVAIHYHLVSNHFPPLGEYTQTLTEVIDGVNSGTLSLDDSVNLGADHSAIPRRAWATPEGWRVNVADFLESTHAWSFIDEEN